MCDQPVAALALRSDLGCVHADLRGLPTADAAVFLDEGDPASRGHTVATGSHGQNASPGDFRMRGTILYARSASAFRNNVHISDPQGDRTPRLRIARCPDPMRIVAMGLHPAAGQQGVGILARMDAIGASISQELPGVGVHSGHDVEIAHLDLGRRVVDHLPAGAYEHAEAIAGSDPHPLQERRVQAEEIDAAAGAHRGVQKRQAATCIDGNAKTTCSRPGPRHHQVDPLQMHVNCTAAAPRRHVYSQRIGTRHTNACGLSRRCDQSERGDGI